MAALERGGADLIELGVPFSDPIADGPVIQRGADRALKAGTNLAEVLHIAQTIRETSQIPLLLFTYLNPVMRYGVEKLARDAKAAGIDGCLLTDVSVEEAEPYVKAMRAAGLDTVFLVAPTSTPRAIEAGGEILHRFRISGFAHGGNGRACSLFPHRLGRWWHPCGGSVPCRWRWDSGFQRRSRLAKWRAMADGVVVGSAFVRLIGEGGDLEAFTRELRRGMDA